MTKPEPKPKSIATSASAFRGPGSGAPWRNANLLVGLCALCGPVGSD